MPATKRRPRASTGRRGRLSNQPLPPCKTHLTKHFDPTLYPNHYFAWCESHGRLPLLSEKTGKPVKTRIFTSRRIEAAQAGKYHKLLYVSLQKEVGNATG